MISVIMSTYNETSFEVGRCIDSILVQTYEDIELIVICDNPNNEQVIAFLSTITDKRVHVYYNEKNKGLVYCLNRGLTLAKGEYIARVDADDYCMRDRFNKQIKYLLDKDMDLIGGWTKLINQDGKVIGEAIYPTEDRCINKLINRQNCLAHPTWLGKKKMFEDVKGYRQIDYCEDYDFLLRVIKKGHRIGNLPDYCLFYQIREESISREHLADQKIRSRYLASLNEQALEDYQSIKCYFQSADYNCKIMKYQRYRDELKLIRHGKIYNIIPMLFNVNTYYSIATKLRDNSIRNKEMKGRLVKAKHI